MSESLGIIGYTTSQQSLASQGKLIHAETYAYTNMSNNTSWTINCGEFSYAIVWVTWANSSDRVSLLNMLITPNMSNVVLYTAWTNASGILVYQSAFSCTSTTSLITLTSVTSLGNPRICVYE